MTSTKDRDLSLWSPASSRSGLTQSRCFFPHSSPMPPNYRRGLVAMPGCTARLLVRPGSCAGCFCATTSSSCRTLGSMEQEHKSGRALREEPGWRKRRRRRRAYDVGAILATDATPATRAPTDVRAYALPAVTRGITWTEESPPRQGRRGKIDYVAGTGVADIAVDVGVALANHPGLVLMFFLSVTWAQSAASRIAADRPQRPDMEPFARAAGDFIGTEHPLVEALQHGCAYHHAQLPDGGPSHS